MHCFLQRGAVILTNLNCYLFSADSEESMWDNSQRGVGAKESKEGDATTGGGLHVGSAAFFQTDNLVMFTDNQSCESFCC